jgi:hypothetical protein
MYKALKEDHRVIVQKSALRFESVTDSITVSGEDVQV